MTRRLLPLALAAVLLSCGSQKGTSVQFHAICAPKADCTFAAVCDLQYIGQLRVDLTSNVAPFKDYTLFVEVHNQALDNSAPLDQRTNTHDAFFREISIDYDGGGLPSTTTNLQQVVPASGTAVIGIQVVNGAGIDTLAANVALGSEAVVTAKVKGKGIYSDGSSFETQEYKIPFRVCRGCTTSCTTSACPHNGQAPNTCGT